MISESEIIVRVLAAGLGLLVGLERKNFGVLTIERDLENGQVMIEAHLQAWKNRKTDELADSLSAISGIRKVKVNA